MLNKPYRFGDVLSKKRDPPKFTPIYLIHRSVLPTCQKKCYFAPSSDLAIATEGENERTLNVYVRLWLFVHLNEVPSFVVD